MICSDSIWYMGQRNATLLTVTDVRTLVAAPKRQEFLGLRRRISSIGPDPIGRACPCLLWRRPERSLIHPVKAPPVTPPTPKVAPFWIRAGVVRSGPRLRADLFITSEIESLYWLLTLSIRLYLSMRSRTVPLDSRRIWSKRLARE